MSKKYNKKGILNTPDSLFAVGLMCFIASYMISDIFYRDEVTSLVALLRIGSFYPMILNELWKLRSVRFISFDFALCVVGILIALSAVVSGKTGLFLIVVVAYYARNVNPRVIITTSFCVIVSFLTLSIVLSLFGVIDENVVIAGGRLRSSLGFSWPSRAQNYLLTAITLFFMARKRQTSLVPILIAGCFAVVLFIFSGARSPFLFCMAMIVLIGLGYYKQGKLSPLMKWVVRHSFLLSAGLSVVAAMFYVPESPVMNAVNVLFSNRLQYSHYAMSHYPFTLFGSSVFGSMNEGYFEGYLDSGYLGVLYTYGIIPFVILIFGYSALARFALFKQSYTLAVCILVVAIHGIVESQLIMLQYSPWILCIPYIVMHHDMQRHSAERHMQITRSVELN